MFAEILLPLVKLFPLDYSIPPTMHLEIGNLVIVNFRSKELVGIVWKLKEVSSIENKTKAIIDKFTQFTLTEKFITYLRKAGDYYLSPYGSIAKLAIPIELLAKSRNKSEINYNFELSLADLSEEHNQALAILKKEQFNVLQGVTGSGKTEVYFNLIKDFLDKGQQVLILLPEIALTSQIITRFIERFAFEPAIWHSAKTLSYKKQVFQDIVSKKAKIIIGARSATFLPYANLGLIIVDEEQDSSYKQDQGILYNARDMAILRSKIFDSKLVLVSATPSIETYYNIKLGKFKMVKLPTRYHMNLPDIKLVDLKKKKPKGGGWLAEELKYEIGSALVRNQQILLFLNRKGYSPMLLCTNCDFRFCCNNCSAWLVYHKNINKLICHYCGYSISKPSNCPECKKDDSYAPCGPGIERIAEEVAKNFPSASICVLSRNETKDSADSKDLIDKITNHEFNIIIGTQIIAKGLHFPSIALVGVIDADSGFNNGDLKAAERTFQLLHQVAGRAGREKFEGTVLVQTYYPNSTFMRMLQNNDYEEFIEQELRLREENEMPPFSIMAAVNISANTNEKALALCKILAKNIEFIPKARVLGPAPEQILRINNKYRYKFIIFASRSFNIQKYIINWLARSKLKQDISVNISPLT